MKHWKPAVIAALWSGALYAAPMPVVASFSILGDVAQQIGGRPDCPVVVCSMGDGTTQQGEVLEAIAEAVRSTLPVLFLVHDNGLGFVNGVGNPRARATLALGFTSKPSP